MRGFATGFLLTLLVWSGACARFNPPPAASSQPSPALTVSNERDLSYLIERQEQGQAKVTSDDFEFKSGDRFRLRFRLGFAAYIYVLNRGAHESSYHVLFPTATEGARNPLAKGAAATVPSDSEWLKFDRSPGNEYLLLIASTLALPELENTPEIPRDTFDAQLAEINRQYQPTSSRRFRDGDWTKFFAAREGDLAVVVPVTLKHQ